MSDDLSLLARHFASFDDDALERQLEGRLRKAKDDPAVGTTTEFSYVPADLGIRDDARELGRKLYYRMSREMYELLCGSGGKDEEDRKTIRNAIGMGDGLVAVLTGVLVTNFAMMPAIAAIVAALLAKRIFAPAGNVFCEFWATKLPPS